MLFEPSLIQKNFARSYEHADILCENSHGRN